MTHSKSRDSTLATRGFIRLGDIAMFATLAPLLFACSGANNSKENDENRLGGSTRGGTTIVVPPGTSTKIATWNGITCKTVVPPEDPPYRHGGTDGGGSGCAVSDSVCGLFEGDVHEDPGHNDHVNLVLDVPGIEAKTYLLDHEATVPYYGSFMGDHDHDYPYIQVVADMWADSISAVYAVQSGTLVLTAASQTTREFVGHVEDVVLVELVKAPNNGAFDPYPTTSSKCLFIDRWDFDTRIETDVPCNNSLDCNNSAMLICDYTSKSCQEKECHDNWPPDDKECPEGQWCWEQNSGWGNASSGQCMPICDVGDQKSCGAGLTCTHANSRDYLRPICMPAGEAALGGPCGGEGLIDTGCVEGGICVWGACHQACDFWGTRSGCNIQAEERCNFLPGQYNSGFCAVPPYDGGGIPHFNSIDPAMIGEQCKKDGDEPWDGLGEGTNHGHRCQDDGASVYGFCDEDLTCREYCRLPMTEEDKVEYEITNGDCPRGKTCGPFKLFDGGPPDFIETFDGLGLCY